MNQKHRSGFTIVELLVVIAVIAILASILFPVFAQVREKGRQTSCLSNVKQIGLGLMMYAQDYDEVFPPVFALSPGDQYYYETSWMNRLQPYARNNGIFVCPSSSYRNLDWKTSADLLKNYAFTPSARATETGANAMTLTSAFGSALFEGLGGFTAPRPIGWYARLAGSHSLGEIARPADTVAITDHKAYDWGMYQSAFFYPDPRHIREGEKRLPNGDQYPAGLINTVLCDGHAKAMNQESLLEIRKGYTRMFGPPADVYIHFWPYE
jgi:prepilin-type N-terminal cleavage/methylation domain-containing protein